MLVVVVSYVEGMQPTDILSLKLESDETYCSSPNNNPLFLEILDMISVVKLISCRDPWMLYVHALELFFCLDIEPSYKCILGGSLDRFGGPLSWYGICSMQILVKV